MVVWDQLTVLSAALTSGYGSTVSRQLDAMISNQSNRCALTNSVVQITVLAGQQHASQQQGMPCSLVHSDTIGITGR